MSEAVGKAPPSRPSPSVSPSPTPSAPVTRARVRVSASASNSPEKVEVLPPGRRGSRPGAGAHTEWESDDEKAIKPAKRKAEVATEQPRVRLRLIESPNKHKELPSLQNIPVEADSARASREGSRDEDKRRAPRQKRKWLKRGQVDPDDIVAVAKQRERHALIDEAFLDLDRQHELLQNGTHPQLTALLAELDRRRLEQKVTSERRWIAINDELAVGADWADRSTHDTFYATREEIVNGLVGEGMSRRTRLRREQLRLSVADTYGDRISVNSSGKRYMTDRPWPVYTVETLHNGAENRLGVLVSGQPRERRRRGIRPLPLDPLQIKEDCKAFKFRTAEPFKPWETGQFVPPTPGLLPSRWVSIPPAPAAITPVSVARVDTGPAPTAAARTATRSPATTQPGQASAVRPAEEAKSVAPSANRPPSVPIAGPSTHRSSTAAASRPAVVAAGDLEPGLSTSASKPNPVKPPPLAVATGPSAKQTQTEKSSGSLPRDAAKSAVEPPSASGAGLGVGAAAAGSASVTAAAPTLSVAKTDAVPSSSSRQTVGAVSLSNNRPAMAQPEVVRANGQTSTPTSNSIAASAAGPSLVAPPRTVTTVASSKAPATQTPASGSASAPSTPGAGETIKFRELVSTRQRLPSHLTRAGHRAVGKALRPRELVVSHHGSTRITYSASLPHDGARFDTDDRYVFKLMEHVSRQLVGLRSVGQYPSLESILKGHWPKASMFPYFTCNGTVQWAHSVSAAQVLAVAHEEIHAHHVELAGAGFPTETAAERKLRLEAETSAAAWDASADARNLWTTRRILPDAERMALERESAGRIAADVSDEGRPRVQGSVEEAAEGARDKGKGKAPAQATAQAATGTSAGGSSRIATGVGAGTTEATAPDAVAPVATGVGAGTTEALAADAVAPVATEVGAGATEAPAAGSVPAEGQVKRDAATFVLGEARAFGKSLPPMELVKSIGGTTIPASKSFNPTQKGPSTHVTGGPAAFLYTRAGVTHGFASSAKAPTGFGSGTGGGSIFGSARVPLRPQNGLLFGGAPQTVDKVDGADKET